MPPPSGFTGFPHLRLSGELCLKSIDHDGCNPEDEAAAAAAFRARGEWRGESIHVRNDGHELNVESGITALRGNGEHAGAGSPSSAT